MKCEVKSWNSSQLNKFRITFSWASLSCRREKKYYQIVHPEAETCLTLNIFLQPFRFSNDDSSNVKLHEGESVLTKRWKQNRDSELSLFKNIFEDISRTRYKCQLVLTSCAQMFHMSTPFTIYNVFCGVQELNRAWVSCQVDLSQLSTLCDKKDF